MRENTRVSAFVHTAVHNQVKTNVQVHRHTDIVTCLKMQYRTKVFR